MTDDRARVNALDYAQVRAYWEDAAGDAESASYMAHEQGLPRTCVEHRFALERAVLDSWFALLKPTAAVLDVGCGAGAWTEYFAGRYRRVVGVDASSGMVRAARRRLAGRAGVEVLHGDALTVPIAGEFDGVLLGGLLMYLDRADAVVLLRRLGALAPNGRIVLRESGIRSGVQVQSGAYQVAYRSVDEYRAIAADAGLRVVEVQRNRGYAHMEVAVTVVDLIRRLPPLDRREPERVGRPLWRLLSATAPVTLDAIPQLARAVGFDWPHLSNHFLLLESK